MVYKDFKNLFADRPLILSRDVLALVVNKQALRNQLDRWTKNGLLLRLKRGIYILNKEDRRVDVSLCKVANVIYEPSYVSLEYALYFYGLIPELVVDLTSVSTRKTAQFSNDMGVFVYQRIKPKCFRGFKSVGVGLEAFFLAEPEKAVVDFIYLRLGEFKEKNICEILEESYRFQNIVELNVQRLKEYAELFEVRKLNMVIKAVIAWVDERKQAV